MAEVLRQYEKRVRVTRTWETTALFEDTKGGGIECVGWPVSAEEIISRCNEDNALITKVEMLDG